MSNSLIVILLLFLKAVVTAVSTNDNNNNNPATIYPPPPPPLPTASYFRRFFPDSESRDEEVDYMKEGGATDWINESLHYEQVRPYSETETSTFPFHPWSVGSQVGEPNSGVWSQRGSIPTYNDHFDTIEEEEESAITTPPFTFFHKMWDKFLISRESGATAAGEQAGERVSAKIIERSGEKLAKRAVSKRGSSTLVRNSRRNAAATAKRSVAGHVTKVGVEHASETLQKGVKTISSSYTPVKIARRNSNRIARKFGRAFLITLPALGGLFAISLFKADLKRMAEVQEEQDDWDWRTTGTLPSYRKHRYCLPSILFGGAAVSDFVDAVSHFFIAYAFLVGLEQSNTDWLESISFFCAAISLFCAVSGEVIGYQRMKTRSGRH
uniref:Transmembrane protein n=1 Tax=Ditylum brightwellii TaxID=49249 RepID=A0A6V2G2V0_9STRA|mmetsp:Transcript_30387/g.44122  ORF Transcript_30387/g.44122 Transcript_30387/m.44122 type:complete len:382 (+) Transcript_30387:172-1317(+)